MDENNPNAMVFQLKGLIKYLAQITATYGSGGESQFIGRLEQALRLFDPDVVFRQGNTELIAWLDETYNASIALSDSLSHRFFQLLRAATRTITPGNIAARDVQLLIAMRYRVLHKTHYQYEGPVMLSQQLLHMSPRDFYAQTCLTHTLEITPPPSESLKKHDYFGNIIDYFAMLTPHRELAVNSSFEVTTDAKAQAWRFASKPRLGISERQSARIRWGKTRKRRRFCSAHLM